MLLDKDRETIIDLYCNGSRSAVGISKLFNVSHKTVANSLKRWGIEKDNYNFYYKVYIPSSVLTDLYNSGKTQAEIAAIFNCTCGTIRRRLRKLSIIRNDSNGALFRKRNLPKNQLIELYENGSSCREIANTFNVSLSVVYNRLKTWNVKLRNFSDCNLVRYQRGVVINESSAYGKGGYHDTPNQGRRWMRSTWEHAVADYLTEQNKSWYYEYKYLLLDNNIKYLPDFYLPGEDKYIEVKGWKNDSSLKKFILASKKYNVELYDEPKLFNLGLINSGGIVFSGRSTIGNE